MNRPITFASLIEQWPSLEELGQDLNISGANARMLKFRDSIPLEHWDLLIAAAKQRGIAAVTYENLVHIAKSRSSRTSKRASQNGTRRKLKEPRTNVNTL